MLRCSGGWRGGAAIVCNAGVCPTTRLHRSLRALLGISRRQRGNAFVRPCAPRLSSCWIRAPDTLTFAEPNVPAIPVYVAIFLSNGADRARYRRAHEQIHPTGLPRCEVLEEHSNGSVPGRSGHVRVQEARFLNQGPQQTAANSQAETLRSPAPG